MPDRRPSTVAILTRAVAAHADTCDLGRWLETYIPTTGEFDRFQRVARLVEASAFEQAEASFALDSAFTKVSAELTFELMAWKDELA